MMPPPMPPRSFDTYPELTTERFHLRQPRLEDAAPLATIYCDPGVARYIGQSAVRTADAMREKLQRDLESASRGEGFRWMLCERGSDAVQGTVGVFHWSQRDRRAEVGYVLAVHQWGRGVMKELMPALLRFGFEDMGLHRMEALLDPRNVASARVLTRAGFRLEGVLREHMAEPEGFSDTAVYSLLEGEWRR
jgi:ribosomal-protein-alanine N-acetyltransferase